MLTTRIKMFSIITSEYKKTRHSIIPKLCLLFPFLTVVLALILNQQFFTIAAYDWWDGIFLFLFIALLCSNLDSLEKKGTHYSIIDSSPISAEKFWSAKIIVACGYLLITNLWFSFLVYSTSLGLGFIGLSQMVPLSLLDNLLASVMLSISTFWQIPLLLIIAHLLGFFIPILLNLAGFALSLFADKSFWYVVPWAWAKRMMMIYAKVQPNGFPMEQLLPPKTDTIIVVSGGILLLLAVSILTGKIFSCWRESR